MCIIFFAITSQAVVLAIVVVKDYKPSTHHYYSLQKRDCPTTSSVEQIICYARRSSLEALTFVLLDIGDDKYGNKY